MSVLTGPTDEAIYPDWDAVDALAEIATPRTRDELEAAAREYRTIKQRARAAVQAAALLEARARRLGQAVSRCVERDPGLLAVGPLAGVRGRWVIELDDA